jgi:anthranilate synthase/aminodeoxychorismate synthase-like glutamine amidotransferase
MPSAPTTSARSSARIPRGAIWLLDNYDSFTRNLADLLEQLGARVVVVRNDATTPRAVLSARPAGVVVSPGPKTPSEAGISVALVRACAAATPPVPVLGVCLGHQAIGEAFGGRTVRARRPVHGRATVVSHRGEGWLAGLPCPFPAARYHSLVVDGRRLPEDLVVTAWSTEGEVMALRHRSLPIEGVQFHPESYLTPDGPRILAAFLKAAGVRGRDPVRVVR